jgi:arylsulfatase A
LGVGDLGVTGHPTTHTPNIDALANGGVRFTAWYSGFHICSPSRAAMLTGRLCVRSGTCGAGWLGGVFSNKPVGGLPTSEITFASALKNVGYTTCAMGKW